MILLKFLDVAAVLFKYCANCDLSIINSESQAVVIDLIASIGFLCVKNTKNQVNSFK